LPGAKLKKTAKGKRLKFLATETFLTSEQKTSSTLFHDKHVKFLHLIFCSDTYLGTGKSNFTCISFVSPLTLTTMKPK